MAVLLRAEMQGVTEPPLPQYLPLVAFITP